MTTSVDALVRVRGVRREIFAVWPAGDLAPMTTLVVEAALDRASPAPGVHRVVVDKSGARVERMAGAVDTVARVRVVREARDVVRVVDVVTSAADHASDARVDERLERSIAEAVAAVGPSIPEGKERVVDVVVADADADAVEGVVR